jgi:hypothetical protein
MPHSKIFNPFANVGFYILGSSNVTPQQNPSFSNDPRLKSITTGQTWGRLISCTYDWPSEKEELMIIPPKGFSLK